MTTHVDPSLSDALYPSVKAPQLEYWRKLNAFEPLLQNETLVEHVLLLKFSADSLCKPHAAHHHDSLVQVWRKAFVDLYLIKARELCYGDRQQIQVLISLCVFFNSELG